MGVIEGKVAQDGTLATHEYVEDTDLAVDSLRCTEHGDSLAFEKFVGGEWCRWVPCENCDGWGKLPRYYGSSVRDVACHDCKREGGAWLPCPGDRREP